MQESMGHNSLAFEDKKKHSTNKELERELFHLTQTYSRKAVVNIISGGDCFLIKSRAN